MNQSVPIPRVILVGNYSNDGQESMLRFSNALLRSLTARGVDASLISPQPFVGRLKPAGTGLGKWLGYIDKFVLFPFQLKRAVRAALRETGAAGAESLTRRREEREGNSVSMLAGPPHDPFSENRARVVVHICDHSNAMYSGHLPRVPLAITCHDLLAVRGALGEETDCPASPTGRLLQRWILRGLARAGVLVCISTATKDDADRLVAGGGRKTRLALLGFNHPYKVLAAGECARRLAPFPMLRQPFLLHVGSNARRKNREGVLRIFQKAAGRWSGSLVFAGQSLTPELWQLARQLGIAERVLEVVRPGDDLLEALYNGAFALLFPSTFEGFGWPIIEAQACGCPVVCNNCQPFREVVGEGGLMCNVTDEEGFAGAVLQLADPAFREHVVQEGLSNIQRFSMERMVDEYIGIYRDLSCPQEKSIS